MSFRLEAISTMYLRSHTALPTALLDLKVMVILRASPCDGSQQEAVIAKNLREPDRITGERRRDVASCASKPQNGPVHAHVTTITKHWYFSEVPEGSRWAPLPPS